MIAAAFTRGEQIDAAAALVQALALVGLAVSVVYVMRQTKELQRQNGQMSEAITVDSAMSLHNSYIAVSQALLEYPQLRPLFYEREGPYEGTDPHDQARALLIAEMLCDVMETWFLLRGSSAVFDKVGAYYAQYTADAFEMSEFFTEYIRERRAWYQPDLVQLADNAAARRSRLRAAQTHP